MDLSIIVVTYNSAACIRDCLESIDRTSGGLDIEVIVVDNASQDDTLCVIADVAPRVTVIRNRDNAGFPVANNQAIALARGRYVVLLNPDTIVKPGAFQTMVAFMDATPSCGVCGPTLEDAHGRIAEDLRRPSFRLYLTHVLGFRRLLKRHLRGDQREIVSGACLMFRRALAETVGVLDPDLFWCEDIDFCVRAVDRGYTVELVPTARVVHLEGDSARSNLSLVLDKQYTSKVLYLRKHASGLETRLVIVLFMLQLFARMVKWSALVVLDPTPEARIRARTCRFLLGELPRYLDTGYPKTVAG